MLDVIVGDPRQLRNRDDVDEVIMQLDAFKAETGQARAGVAQVVNPSLGGSYQIMSEEMARVLLARRALLVKRPVEYATVFYPRAYFDQLREKYGPRSSS